MTAKKLSRQDILDKTVKHLSSMTCRSMKKVNGLSTCLYRGPNGSKCAIGALIPDKMYDPVMESNTVSQLIIEEFPAVSSLFYKKDLETRDFLSFLDRVQTVHDNEYNWRNNKFVGYKSIASLARQYNLKYDGPES